MLTPSGPLVIPPFVLVLDVESVGLHGEGFAAAWAVLDLARGIVLHTSLLACDSNLAQGTHDDRLWIKRNVPPLEINCAEPAELRRAFWSQWLHWRALGAWLVVDSAWPVETNFLSTCVHEAGTDSAMLGPCPLIDVAACFLVQGMDADVSFPRKADDLPPHHPLADVRHTARKFMALLNGQTWP